MSERWRDARVLLGQWPAPVRPVEGLRPGLWLKDESQVHPDYAGNKVRKLEFLLPACGPRIVTVGAVGSHHVLATAVHGSQRGHEVEAVAMPRPSSAHTLRTLRATLPRCALHPVGSLDEARATLRRLAEEGRSLIPAGGSSWRGALGFVEAAFELAEQVRAGALPEPRRIFVPLGTAGTAVGLAIGCQAAGLASEVVASRVVPELWLDAARIRRLAEELSARAGLPLALPRIEERFFGAGYGESTPQVDAAVARAAAQGLFVEPTYTGKALAAALEATGGPDLYWYTLNQRPLEPLFGPEPDPADWPLTPA
ncbi:MAG: pyridoxal-phosphate dependent enzyme [Alphaproteobacteria bacterium]|nr:pyridoxal-phosphate dependent enzyme [Alphaproteobacteria bacterium]